MCFNALGVKKAADMSEIAKTTGGYFGKIFRRDIRRFLSTEASSLASRSLMT